jgi:hypothetical protein
MNICNLNIQRNERNVKPPPEKKTNSETLPAGQYLKFQASGTIEKIQGI